MKKVVLVFAVMVSTYLAHAQFDSAAIVQQHTSLRNNISSYTNRPFSVLYNALTIKPNIVTAFSPHNNMYVEDVHKFYYGNPNNLSARDVYIYVEWETPIPKTEARINGDKIRRDFNTQEYPNYANRIIKKVQFFPDPMIDENGVYLKKKPEVKKVSSKKKVK